MLQVELEVQLKNEPLDQSLRLPLLDHADGNPLIARIVFSQREIFLRLAPLPP